jgi:hypothetical protein
MTDFNASVSFTATPDEVLAALEKITQEMEEAAKGADAAGESIKKMPEGGAQGSENLIGKLAMMTVGFATLAGAAEKALDLVVEGIKNVIDFIPEALDKTRELAMSYDTLRVTADLSSTEFTKFSAALVLSGAKVEDLSSIVRGMERGIRTSSEYLVENGIAANKAALEHMDLGEYLEKVVQRMDTLGTASERDQLLLHAFGRGGMEFARVLVEMTHHMEEAQAVMEKGGALDAQTLANMHALIQSQGRLKIAKEEYDAAVASGASGTAIALNQAKAKMYEAATEQERMFEAARHGYITTHTLANDYIIDLKRLKADYEALKEAERSGAADLQREMMHFRDTTPAKPLKDPDEEKQKREAAEKARKQREEEEAKAERERMEVMNNLQEQAVRLGKEDLQMMAAKTVAEKQQRADEEAKLRLQEEQRRIGGELARSDTPENWDTAQKAGAAAQKLYADTILANARKASEERQQVEQKNQEQLNKMEADGWQKRVAVIHAGMEKIRDEIRSGNDSTHTLEQVDQAESHAIAEEKAKAIRQAAEQMGEEFRKFRSNLAPLDHSLEHTFNGIMTGAIKSKEIFSSFVKDIGAGIASALARLAASYITSAIAAALFQSTTAAANVIAAGTAQDLAASEIWAAYAPIPFGGTALALAEISVMEASIAGVAGASKGFGASASSAPAHALAEGGYVDSPTLALIGEAGYPEVVMPETSFQDYFSGTLSMGASLARAQDATNRSVSSYSRVGASYASQAARRSAAGGNGGVVVNIAGHVIGEGIESARIIGDHVSAALDNYNRRNN